MTASASSGVLRMALSGHRRGLIGASFLLACHQVAEAGVPILVGVVIDRAVEPASGRALVAWLAALTALFAVLSVAFRFGARLAERTALLAEHDLRQRLLGDLLGREAARVDTLPGALLNLATSDAARVAALNWTVATSAAAIAALLVAAVALLSAAPTLGLVVLVGLPPLLFGMQLLARPLERRSQVEQAVAGAAAGVATDLVSGLRTLKGLGAERAAAARYRRTSQESLRATVRAATAEAVYNGAALAATGLFLALVALVGGRLASEGQISVGELIAALGLSQFLIGPIARLGALPAALAQARASAARVASALAETAGAVGDGGPAGSSIEIDLHVAPGEVVGVAAADPEDAAALLARLRAGQGHPAQAALLVVPHDADLFSGSIGENVRAAAEDPARIDAALAAAAADEVVDSVSGGLDANVGERGQLLSGGQRQRVALARALATAAPFLVLHDPTTAVDPVTEARIAEGIRALRSGKATLLVTTSPALLTICDRVLLLHEGAVIAEGTHAALLERAARYREVVLA